MYNARCSRVITTCHNIYLQLTFLAIWLSKCLKHTTLGFLNQFYSDKKRYKHDKWRWNSSWSPPTAPTLCKVSIFLIVIQFLSATKVDWVDMYSSYKQKYEEIVEVSTESIQEVNQILLKCKPQMTQYIPR